MTQLACGAQAERRAGQGSDTAEPQPDDGAHSSSRVGLKWDREAALIADPAEESTRRRYWTHHPVVRRWVDQRGGGPLAEWLETNLPRNVGTVVSLGSGVADTELSLLANAVIRRLILFDPSQGSLQAALQTAARLGVADQVTTFPTEFTPHHLAQLPEVDAVLFLSSLHHFPQVQDLLAGLREGLRPGARILVDEYVGPDRFAFPAAHRRAADVAYQSIPRQLRCQWPTLPAPDPVAVADDDPSEAQDSSQILPAVHRVFGAGARVWPIGGALAYQIWHGLDHEAVFQTSAGDGYVRRLVAQDAFLTDSGTLPPYFARAACTVER